MTSRFAWEVGETTRRLLGNNAFMGSLTLRRSDDGRADAEGKRLGTLLRGIGPCDMESRARALPIRAVASASRLRGRHAAAVSERLVAHRRRHGVFDDRHARPRP